MVSLGTYKTKSGRKVGELVALYTEARVVPALKTEMYQEASGILAASMPLVPVDTGALRASGYVSEPLREGNRITVTVGYGGVASKINPKTGESTAGYALYVHENLEAFHKVGTAKYLELPFNAATRDMSTRIVRNIRNRLMGGASLGGSK